MSEKACKAQKESSFKGRKKCASKDNAVEAMSTPETQSMCKTGTILVGEARCPRKENTQKREQERQRKEQMREKKCKCVEIMRKGEGK